MKVYELSDHVIRHFASALTETSYDSLAFYLIASSRSKFRYTDLINYGLDSEDIENMLENGSLSEVNVPQNEAISIARYHKFHQDRRHRGRILSNMKKACRSNDAAKQKGWNNVAEYRRKRNEYMLKRRKLLVERVLKPEFYEKDENGRYKSPDSISPVEVVRSLQKYPKILAMFRRRPETKIRKDLTALGIKRRKKPRSKCE